MVGFFEQLNEIQGIAVVRLHPLLIPEAGIRRRYLALHQGGGAGSGSDRVGAAPPRLSSI